MDKFAFLSTSSGHLWTQNQRCSTENLKHLWLELFVKHLCCVHKCKGRRCSTKSLEHLLHYFVEHLWCVHPPLRYPLGHIKPLGHHTQALCIVWICMNEVYSCVQQFRMDRRTDSQTDSADSAAKIQTMNG